MNLAKGKESSIKSDASISRLTTVENLSLASIVERPYTNSFLIEENKSEPQKNSDNLKSDLFSRNKKSFSSNEQFFTKNF